MYKTRTNKMADLQEVKGGSGGNDYGMGNSTWDEGRDFLDFICINKY